MRSVGLLEWLNGVHTNLLSGMMLQVGYINIGLNMQFRGKECIEFVQCFLFVRLLSRDALGAVSC